jgi:hypothetical protein
MSIGKSDLVRLVNDFGQAFFYQDLRVTKTFSYRKRWKLAAFAERFNCLNLANLGGYSGDPRNTPASCGSPRASSRCSVPAGREPSSLARAPRSRICGYCWFL